MNLGVARAIGIALTDSRLENHEGLPMYQGFRPKNDVDSGETGHGSTTF